MRTIGFPTVLAAWCLVAEAQAIHPQLWAQRDYGTGTVNLTFAGQPHSPAAAVAKAVADVGAWIAPIGSNSTPRTALALAPIGASGTTLSALIDAGAGEKFLLEASGSSGTTKFWANADAVTAAHDWFDIQDMATAELEITLRDPYMRLPNGTTAAAASARRLLARVKAGAGTGVGGAVDNQCAQGVPVQDGNACVVAVVRFQGRPLMNAGVNITTWNPASHEIMRVSTSKYGVTIVQVPLPGSDACAGAVATGHGCPFFASVSYIDTATATTHFATTSGVTQR